MKEGIQFRKQAQSVPEDLIGAVYSVGFDNPYPRRMWFFNRYSKYTPKAYGANVTEMDARGRETNRIVAAEAWYDPDQRAWVFKNGREMGFDSETRENTSSAPFATKIVTRFQEDPRLMMLIDRRPIDLSSTELRELIDYLSRENNPKSIPYAVRYYGLIADILGPLIVIAIAIPFAASGVQDQSRRRRLEGDRPLLPLHRAAELRRVAGDEAAGRPGARRMASQHRDDGPRPVPFRPAALAAGPGTLGPQVGGAVHVYDRARHCRRRVQGAEDGGTGDFRRSRNPSQRMLGQDLCAARVPRETPRPCRSPPILARCKRRKCCSGRGPWRATG